MYIYRIGTRYKSLKLFQSNFFLLSILRSLIKVLVPGLENGRSQNVRLNDPITCFCTVRAMMLSEKIIKTIWREVSKIKEKNKHIILETDRRLILTSITCRSSS